ncbi:MAG: GTPase HflX [Gammaproteobacteria bacterium]|nr:GTPase HflX [Gammaproteobacteria bacterium]
MLSFFASSCPRAILIQIDFYRQESPDFDELKELAKTARVESVDQLIFSRDHIDPRFYMGEGKVQELEVLIPLYDANLIIFNHDLTPTQERNLNKRLNIQVMSRTGLILEIFSQRARTHEGKLQVELAHLDYQATRLVRGWTHLERQRGGIGVRGGPGETQLEIDKRLLRQKMKQLKHQIEKVKSQRQLGRASRQKSDMACLALVGYTNAGKSTLFNLLCQSDVYVANQLFATLDPSLRKLILPHYGEMILADTVGFIRNLPHSLVEAFKSTLEEVIEATLLIHVIDASHPDYLLQKQQVLHVLEEIGAGEQPILEVMNKIDLAENQEARIDYDEAGLPIRVWISALKSEGEALLLQAILQRLSPIQFNGILVLPPARGEIRSVLYSWQAVRAEEVDEVGASHLTLSVALHRLERLFSEHELNLEEYLLDLKPVCI